MDLQDRTVLITGASRGIGAATARAFAAYPLRLALLARSPQPLQALADELNARPGVQALPLVADVASLVELKQALEQTKQRLGPVDILINNAGIGMRSPAGGIDFEAARQVFDVNFWGALNCIEAVLPDMKARGEGLIINISSIIGRRAMPVTGVYCASKFALNGLSDSIRIDLRPYNVRVTTFYPGVTATDFTKNELTGDASGQSRGIMPIATPETVGRAIVRAAQREPRDAYATLFDRFFVLGTAMFPRLADWGLGRFYGG